MTIMEKNAAEYGLDGITADAPLEYDSVDMASPTHLALISDMTNTPVSELQSLNPALLKGLAPVGYSLHVPKGAGSYLMAALQVVPSERRASWRMHTVEDGETLASIGKRYRTAAGTIAAINSMQSRLPATGDRLLIPAAYHETAPVRVAAKRSSGHRTVAKNRKAVAHHRQSTASSKGRVKHATAFRETSSKVALAGK
jgi:membrane-bound lytic murein transglycosylase D